MGAANSKKPEITIQAIRSNTQEIRTSLRKKQVPLQSKENLHQTLVNNSKELNNLRATKSKKKQLEIDQIQKLVRDVNEELLEYNDDCLDKNADESHSFIHVGGEQLKNRKKKSLNAPQGRRSSAKIHPKLKRPLNLSEIEQKLVKVKEDVSTGLKHEDVKQLQLQKQIIEDLSTSLELINIPQTSSSYSKKLNLEKELRRTYQKIIRRDKNKSKPDTVKSEDGTDNTDNSGLKLRNIEIMLEDIHDILQNTVKGDNRGNLKEINDELVNIEKQLDKINDTTDMNGSKTLLMKKVIESEEFLKEIEKKKEMNDLDEIMDEIDKLKTEIQIQKETNKGKVIQEIETKGRKLKNLNIKYGENKKFREDYLEELDKFLEIMKPSNYSVVLRKKELKMSKSVEDLIHLQEEWTSLQNNMSVTKTDEVKKINDLLEKFEESIRAKRKSLVNMMSKAEPEPNRRKSAEVIRTSAKIYDLPKLQTTKSKENIPRATKQDSTPIKFGSIEYALGEISKISDRVEEIGKEVICFDGTTENLEFNFFMAALMDKQTVLKGLKHRASWNQVDAFKKEVLEKIDFYQEYLRYKLNQNVSEEKLQERLDNIEGKIKRFTGSFQSVHYNNLEVDLTNCQKDVTQIDNKEKNEILKNRMNYLKKMLKEKSQIETQIIKDENLTDTRKIISENKEYLKTLRENIENTSSLDVNQCAVVEECLMSKTLELINLNVRNDTSTFNELKKLLEEIDICKKLVKSKLRTREEMLKDLESNLDELQMEISFFEGLPNDETYNALLKQLGDLEIKLCSIRGTNESTEKNLELSLRINFLKNRLEKLSLVSEKILQVEKRVREILEIVSNGVPEEDYDRIDEELINTKIDVEKVEVSEKLSYRKITCLSYIEYLLKKMNEKMNKGNAQVSSSVLV